MPISQIRNRKNNKKHHKANSSPLESEKESIAEPKYNLKEFKENNNTVLFQKESSENDDDESNLQWCVHMEETSAENLETVFDKRLVCCTCSKKAYFSCFHSDCVAQSGASCCQDVSHIFSHVVLHNHPVIVHHKLQLVLCTCCNFQVSVKQFLRNFELKSNGDSEFDRKPINLQAVMGYINFGNTCYMNAVFQLLGHCSPFAEYFTTYIAPDELNNSQAVARSTAIQLALDFRLMWSPIPVPFLSPWRIIHCIRAEMPAFESFQQQDAAEFLRALLDIVDRELKIFAEVELLGTEDEQEYLNLCKKNHYQRQTIVTDTFQGTLENRIHCHSCGFQSKTFENFLDLSVPILSELEELEKHFLYSKETFSRGSFSQEDCDGFLDEGGRGRNTTSLTECINRFFQKNNLYGDNQYSCCKCNKLVDATKTTKAVVMPEVIMIQLKRFRHTMHGTRKVDKVVEFPIHLLDFGRWTSSGQELMYDLAGFVVHEGHTVEFGHYVTYVKHEHDKMWYKFDDLNITRSDASRVAEQQPYILMFKRRHGASENSRRQIGSYYNSAEANRRYMEQHPSGWSLIENALKGNRHLLKSAEQTSKASSRLLSADEISRKEAEEMYERLSSMMKEINESIEMNKTEENNHPQSHDNTQEAVTKLVKSLEEWLKEIMRKEWNENKMLKKKFKVKDSLLCN
uniref:Ubiquitin carboxyl-terminal hydrolase n=1 Tax=Caenorhabditis japonica TaxID=281687 RepID=A0A8R1E4E4_CAEJA